MSFDLGRSGRATANATFYGLVALAFGLLASLSGFVSYFAPLYETCRSVWDNVLLWLSSVSVLVPIGIVASVVLVAVLTLTRQWLATQRLLRALGPYRVPAPPRLARIACEVGLEDRIDCVDGLGVGPFCHGFVQPRVCVPAALLDILDDVELRAVLRHEDHHRRSRDPLKMWLSRALARGLYFLPLAGDLRDSYLAAKEVAADEIMAQPDELPLASALVKIISAGRSAGGPRLAPAFPMLSSVEVTAAALGDVAIAGFISVTRVPAEGTEERIRRLVDGEPAPLWLPSIGSVVLSVLIVVAIFAVSYTNLGATSVMPLSQECVTEKLLRRPASGTREPALQLETSDWAQSSGLANRRPTVVAGVDAAFGQRDCALLTPSCQRVER